MSPTPLESWVDEAATLTKPDNVVWCDGSDQIYQALVEEDLRTGVFFNLDAKTYHNCYLHRSHPGDMARTEHLTFICTPDKEDAGPNNNWKSPTEAKERVGALFQGCMKGRTLHVPPYIMGPMRHSCTIHGANAQARIPSREPHISSFQYTTKEVTSDKQG